MRETKLSGKPGAFQNLAPGVPCATPVSLAHGHGC
jgi:hypothetical protein